MDNNPWIAISMPVYDRAWILDDWFYYIENQDWPIENLGFIFELAPNDNSTLECLIKFHERHRELRCFNIQANTDVEHKTHPEGARTWSKDHYNVMCSLRNSILQRATILRPDRLFSLDSDILLEDSTTISQLFELTKEKQAVGTLSYMTPFNIDFPSVMTWVPDGRAWRDHSRYRLGEIFQADIIMAAIMMTPVVYRNIRYQWHKQGEDLGFATQCRDKGISMWCASNIYTPHIMSRQMLIDYKSKGDYRKSSYLQRVAELHSLSS